MAGIADTPATATLPGSPPQHISFRIRPSHVRALLWLRMKLTLRGYSRSTQRIIGLIAMLVFLLSFGGGLAVSTAAAYTQLSGNAAVQVLFGVLVLLYVIWAILPLMQYTLNEGLDVTKLQIYPLTRGEQMVSLVLATLMDVSTIFIVLLYAAIVIGWHATPAATIVTVIALVLAYIHTVGFSQLMLAALMGLLRSRRFRDLSAIIFALFGSLFVIANQVFFRTVEFADPASFANLHLDTYLQWTPPGMAGRAIVLANQGEYLQSLPWLLAAAVLIPLLLVIWALVLDRGITTAESFGAAPSARTRRRAAKIAAGSAAGERAGAATPRATSGRAFPRLLSRSTLAIARKDALYLWRDPQQKAALISSLVVAIFVFLPGLYTGPTSATDLTSVHAFQVLFAPLPALLMVLTLSQNALGMERQGLQTLFLFPVRPLDVFWGKNLVVGAFSFGVQIVLTVGLAAMTGGWMYVPLALFAGLAAVLVMLGTGNITSVISPFRVRQMRMGDTGSMSSENGCLRSVIAMASMLATGLLLLPVVAALALPLLLDHRAWLIVALPAAALYGITFHQVATRLIAPRLLARAPEILAATVREV